MLHLVGVFVRLRVADDILLFGDSARTRVAWNTKFCPVLSSGKLDRDNLNHQFMASVVHGGLCQFSSFAIHSLRIIVVPAMRCRTKA